MTYEFLTKYDYFLLGICFAIFMLILFYLLKMVISEWIEMKYLEARYKVYPYELLKEADNKKK